MEVAYKTLDLPKLEYAAPVRCHCSKLQIIRRKFRGQQLAGPAGDGETRVVLAKCLMSLMPEWPSLEVDRDQSSLLLFHKIHCGAVFIEKDKYMAPAHSLKTTNHHIVLNNGDTRH